MPSIDARPTTASSKAALGAMDSHLPDMAASQPSLLMLISSLSAGGAERVMSDMASYWAGQGWGIDLVTWTGTDVPDFYPLHPAVRRIHLNLTQPTGSLLQKVTFNMRRLYALRRVIKTRRADTILAFMDSNNVLAILASRFLRVRVIVSERTDPAVNPTVALHWRVARTLFYRYADCLVAQTAGAAYWLKTHCQAEAMVVPNLLRSLPEPSQAREKIVVSVGRLNTYKGFDVLLEAWSQLPSAFGDWKLIILGEGPERNNLERLCAELQLAPRVEMPGQVKDVEQWFARAGLVVQMSRFEGFPNVILEAMGMGAAVISADCRSGPSELIESGVNGQLVPVDDVEALTRVMIELMGNENERRQLGVAALEVRQRYSQSKIMRKWEAILAGG